jgi:PAS domain-containing protein
LHDIAKATPSPSANVTTPAPHPTPLGAELMLGSDGLLVVRRFLLVVLVVSVASGTHGLWTYGPVPSLFGAFGATIAAALSYVLMRRGHVRISIQVILWTLTAIVLALTLNVAGLRTPALYLLPGICVFAAWVAGLRTALAVFTVSSVFLLGLVAAETWWGYLPPQEVRSSPSVAIVLIPAIFISLLVAVTAIKSYQKQIASVLALSQTQREQLEALRLSEERFFALFRANPTPSSTVDNDGRTMEVNSAWETLFGIPQDTAYGKTTGELGLWVDPAMRGVLLSAMQTDGKVDGLPVALNTALGPRAFLI